MSLGYVEHSKTRYLRNHYEIYDYRKEKAFEIESLAAGRLKREEALEARQQERREALEALIEANRVYTPSNRVMQEIEEEARQKRVEKEAARERRAKAAADKEANDKFRAKQASRSAFHSHLVSTREDRTARLEKQAQFNQIERDRRAKEREARSYAKSGAKADSSDSEEEKKPVRSSNTSRYSSRTPTASSASSRLLSKYRDAPSSQPSRHDVSEATHASSSHVKSSSSSDSE